MQIERRRPDVLVIDDALNATERAMVLADVEAATFETQMLGIGGSNRSRQRAVIESLAIERLLWRAIADLVRPIANWFDDLADDHWEATGCNQRSRIYRYGIGSDFKMHADEPWTPFPRRRSMLTLLLYLPTAGCVGGETVVDGEVIAPVDWRIALFDHRLQHEGKPVVHGQKLVLRNDVIADAID